MTEFAFLGELKLKGGFQGDAIVEPILVPQRTFNSVWRGMITLLSWDLWIFIPQLFVQDSNRIQIESFAYVAGSQIILIRDWAQ